MQEYKDTISSTLKRRYLDICQKNPRYSMRSFANKLGLSPGGLSQVISNKKKLSVSRAHEVAQALELTAQEKERFVLMAQFEGATSFNVKLDLYEQLQKLSTNNVGFDNLELDKFSMISNWYGLAILETLAIESKEWTVGSLAEFLGLQRIEADVTLDCLKRLGLVVADEMGRLRRSPGQILVSSNVPNEAIRNYYHDVIELADQSIDNQTPDEKIVGADVFAFDTAQLEELRELTNNYLDQLLHLARKGNNRKHVYQVFVDVFKLNRKEISDEKIN